MDTRPNRYLLSQGNLIDCPQTDQALAKKAWFYLFEHFMRGDEILKAFHLPVPWHMEDDMEVRRELSLLGNRLERYSSIEKVREAIIIEEEKELKELPSETLFKGIRKIPRARWVIDKVISYNPVSVLDIGAGWGEIATEVAKLGIQVTAISPHEAGTEYAKELQAERNLQVTWIHTLFEDVQFQENKKFDVVLACEIIEHILDDRAFLKRAFSLAKDALILTTPHGPTTKGWPTFDFRDPIAGQHIRAHSETSLKALIGVLHEEATLADWDIQQAGVTPFGPMNCLCVVLERIK